MRTVFAPSRAVFRAGLPMGRPLPAADWRRRHRAILVILWLHVVAFVALGLLRGHTAGHSLADAAPVAILTALAAWSRPSRRWRAACASLGLVTASAIQVHLAGGYIEAHFHFFVVVIVISLYREWVPFLLAIGYVAVHHGLVGTLAPTLVYNHPDAWAHPWKWAAIHAGFVLAASAASLVNWRLQEAQEAALRTSEASLAEAQRLAHLGNWEYELGTGVLTWSDETYRILGLARRGLVPTLDAFLARVHPDDRPAVERALRAAIADRAGYDLEFRLVRPGGAVRTIHAHGEVREATDRPTRLVGIMLDITERKVLEAELAHQATHDPLTGLPNRALFLDRLDHALARARRDWQSCAVLFLDLDRFKTVNDSLGHAAGDRLLIAVAARLQGCLRDGDTVARLGGDEFAILMEGVASPVETLRLAERILAALQEPLPLDGRELIATTSVGIALSTDSGDTPADLLRFADVALYRAKEAGRACYAIFYPGMNADALERLELEHDLRGAVGQGACAEFRLLYQPLVDLATGRVAGVEALLRWQHPARGLVSPGDFIPLAEETGLIVPLGRWVLGEACRQLRAWQARYPDRAVPTLAVNLSARQFRHPDLVADVAAILAATDLAPRHLQLEVTESVAMERAEETVATLAALKALGLSLAIDDFGTGYSSLSYLQRLPVDVLKIDQSFFRANERNRAIVQAVAALAHGLGLDVTAEGLETAEQVAWARAAGGDRGQGYYFAHPLLTEELDALWAGGLSFTLPGGGQVPVAQASASVEQLHLVLAGHVPDGE